MYPGPPSHAAFQAQARESSELAATRSRAPVPLGDTPSVPLWSLDTVDDAPWALRKGFDNERARGAGRGRARAGQAGGSGRPRGRVARGSVMDCRWCPESGWPGGRVPCRAGSTHPVRSFGNEAQAAMPAGPGEGAVRTPQAGGARSPRKLGVPLYKTLQSGPRPRRAGGCNGLVSFRCECPEKGVVDQDRPSSRGFGGPAFSRSPRTSRVNSC